MIWRAWLTSKASRNGSREQITLAEKASVASPYSKGKAAAVITGVQYALQCSQAQDRFIEQECGPQDC